MPDQPPQPPTQEETSIEIVLTRMHLVIGQMRKATRDSYDAISVSNELLVQADQILHMRPPALASRQSGTPHPW
jgi:hypothetical protein